MFFKPYINFVKPTEQGIGTGLHFRAVHEQKYYRDNMAMIADLPNTEYNSARICSLQ